MHPGCAVQLSYKILLDAGLDKPEKDEEGKLPHKPIPNNAWITSLSTSRHFLQGEEILQVANPPAASDFCFMDEETCLSSLPELLMKDDCFVICVNLSGKMRFARDLSLHGYTATASPAFYEDFLAKIRKAASMEGLRFIEVITPCPIIWKSDPSNTIELCRQAVDIGLWPLFRAEHGVVSVSYKPTKLEPKVAFEAMQEIVRVDEEELEKNWRKFLIKPYESEI